MYIRHILETIIQQYNMNASEMYEHGRADMVWWNYIDLI